MQHQQFLQDSEHNFKRRILISYYKVTVTYELVSDCQHDPMIILRRLIYPVNILACNCLRLGLLGVILKTKEHALKSAWNTCTKYKHGYLRASPPLLKSWHHLKLEHKILPHSFTQTRTKTGSTNFFHPNKGRLFSLLGFFKARRDFYSTTANAFTRIHVIWVNPSN